MFELTIKDTTYQFNFGLGFLRELNKTVEIPVDGVPGKKKHIGMRYTIAEVIDGDVEALCQTLRVANKGFVPRLEQKELDAYVEDDETDIDDLFETVVGFLENANVTKKETADLKKAVEEQKAKEAAEKAKETM